MTIELLSIDDAIEDNGVKILCHGPAGAGKTVLSTTTDAPTIIINAESGLLSLRPIIRENPEIGKLIRIVTVADMDDLKDVYLFLKEEKRCDWICLDSISEIAETILSAEKKNTSDPRKAYGKMQDDVADMLRAFRDLPEYNVYMSCKQDRKEDQYTGITRYRPSLPGQNLPQSVPYMFDEVFALRCEQNEDGELERMLQTNRDIQYDAKDRSGCLDMYELPHLGNVLKKIEGGKPVHVTGKVERTKLEEKEENKTAE